MEPRRKPRRRSLSILRVITRPALMPRSAGPPHTFAMPKRAGNRAAPGALPAAGNSSGLLSPPRSCGPWLRNSQPCGPQQPMLASMPIQPRCFRRRSEHGLRRARRRPEPRDRRHGRDVTRAVRPARGRHRARRGIPHRVLGHALGSPPMPTPTREKQPPRPTWPWDTPTYWITATRTQPPASRKRTPWVRPWTTMLIFSLPRR